MKNKKGFTALELLTVIFIIIVLLVTFPDLWFIMISKPHIVIIEVVLIIITAFLLNIIFSPHRSERR